MPESYSVSVAGDFSPLYRQASEAAKQVQLLFSKSFLQGSSFSRPLGEITGKADEFAKSMAAANARVIAFGASAGLVYAVTKAIKDMITATIDANKALTDVNVILNLNNENLQKFSSQLVEVAKITGQSFGEIAKGATELARQGLGAEETLTRIKDAAILARQSGLDMTDSVEALTAAINSFSRTALDSTQIINKLANVDQQFAVSSKDLVEGIKRVGSTAQDSGVSIDELIALITTAQQTTSRGGAVIGNALKTIFTRIERPEVLNQLEEAGVRVRDLEGNVRPTIDVLKEYAKTFQQVSSAQQSHLAELVGSVYQINVLKALVEDLNKNYGVFGKALRTSSEAQDEAIRRNDEYNKSLDAILNKVKVTIKSIGVSIGNETVAPAIKKVIDDIGLLADFTPDSFKDIGKTIGEGMLKGLGDFISGPGIVLLGATIGKLTKDLGSFFFKASKDFFGLNAASKQQEELTTKIQGILAAEPRLIDSVLNKRISQVKLEEQLLALTKERLAVESQLARVTQTASVNLLARSEVTLDQNHNLIQPTKKASRGLIPNFISPEDGLSELLGAVEGGYVPGKVKKLRIKGIGEVLYNDAEKIKDFGFDQPAILPPASSKAGREYRGKFKQVHGFDPYSELVTSLKTGKLLAKGLVPDNALTPSDNFKTSIPVGIMTKELGKSYALTDNDSKALGLEKIVHKPEKNRILQLGSLKDVEGVFGNYGATEDDFKDLQEALGKHDRKAQSEIIRQMAKSVKRGLMSSGLTGLEIPSEKSNSKTVFLDVRKNAARGLIPQTYPKGLVPTMTALSEAVSRESQFVPLSDIKIGQDGRLVSNQNPLGLGVYNVSDEPLGLQQGIGRALGEGASPQSYGTDGGNAAPVTAAKGRIPNFAESRIYARKIELPNVIETKIQQDIQTSLDEINKLLKGGVIDLDRAMERVKGLGDKFLLTEQSAEVLNKSIRATAQNAETTRERLERNAKLRSAVSPSFQQGQLGFDFAQPVHQGTFNAALPGQPAAPRPLLTSNPQFEFLSILSHADQQTLTRLKNPAPSPAQPQSDLDVVLRQAEIRTRIEAQRSRNAEKELDLERQKAVRQAEFERKLKSFDTFSRFVPGTQANKDVRELLSQNPELNAIERRKSAEKSSNAAIVTSLVAPIVAGVLSQALGNENTATRGLGATAEGVGNVASFGALGRSFGGLHGALIGGAFGLLTSLPSIIEGFTDTLPDLQKEFERIRGSSLKTSEALTQYIQSTEKLEGIYAGLVRATKGTVVKLESQQSEAFSKLTLSQQNRLREALRTRGIQGLNEEREGIDQEGKQDELRKNVQIDLANFSKGIKFFGIFNKLTEDDTSRQIGSRRIQTTGIGVTGLGTRNLDVPIFAQKLTAEAGAQAEAIRKDLLAIRGPLDKTLVDVLSENPQGNKEDIGKIQAGLVKEDIRPFIDFLSSNFEKTGLKGEQIDVLTKGITSLPKEVQSLFVGKILPSFTPEGVKGAKEFSEAFRALSQKLQKDIDNFADRIATVNIALGVFNKTLEGNVRILAQGIAAREERRQTVAGGFVELQSNFAGPSTIAALRNQAALQNIRGQRLADVQNAGLGFQQDASQIISSRAISFLQGELDRSIEEKFIGNAVDTRSNALKFLERLGIGVEGVDKNVKAGNIDETRQGIETILGNAQRERSSILNKESKLPEDRARLKLLEDIERPLREALTDFSSNVELANQKEKQAISLQEILNKQLIDQVNLQKKLSVGGGIQQVLQPGQQFRTELGLAQLKTRIGGATGNDLLKSQGAFEIGNLINSLGATVPDEIRDAIKAGLAQQLRSSFEAAGVTLKQGSFEDIAKTQIDTQFKREDTQEQLLEEMKRAVQNNASLNDNIQDLVSLARGDGIFVRLREELKKDRLNDIRTVAFGKTDLSKESFFFDEEGNRKSVPPYKESFNSFKFDEQLLPARDISTNYESIFKRNIFGLKKNILNESNTSDASAPARETSGVNIDKLMTLITTAEQTTSRGGAVVGNALKTILTGTERPEVTPTKSSFDTEGFRKKAFESINLNDIDLKRADIFKGPLTPVGAQNQFPFISALVAKANTASAKGGLPVGRDLALQSILQNSKGQSPQQLFDLVQAAQGKNEQVEFTRAGVNSASIEAAQRIANLTSNTNEIQKAGISLEQKRVELENKVAKGVIDSLQAQKEFTAEIEKQTSLIALQQFKRGRISGDELRQQKLKESDAKIEAGTYNVSDAFDTFRNEFNYNNKDFFKDLRDSAVDLGSTMKSSFKEGFQAFVDGSKSAGEAARDFGKTVLNKLLERVNDIAIDTVFGALGNVLGGAGLGNLFGSGKTQYFGGIIQGYSRGGRVLGGSGFRDDVPAKLTKGEYVVRRSAVDKYGVDFFKALNEGITDVQSGSQTKGPRTYGTGRAGGDKKNSDEGALAHDVVRTSDNRINAVFANAFAYNSPSRPTGGYFNVSRELSTIAQTDENNPQNQKKFERELEILRYLEDRKSYDDARKLALKKYKNAKEQRLLAAYISAAVNIAGGAARAYGTSSPATSPTSDNNPNNSFGGYSSNYRVAMGGLATYSGFRRYATGGVAFGGENLTDRIPAMLSGGEFVLRKDAVEKYGVDLIDRLNRGSIPKAKTKYFQNGGLVGTPGAAADSYASNDGFNEIISKLGEIASAFKNPPNVREPSRQNIARQNNEGNSLVNNISISVNVDKGGNVETKTNSDKADNDKKNKQDNQRQLGELIKQSVVKVIIEQKRPGGLLAQ
jgi:TP901 family phage tail tape measure protein